jgi:hypothetical protein
MKNRFYWLILILMVGIIAMGACTSSPAAKPTATAPGGFPTGTYKPDKILDVILLKFNTDGTFSFEFQTDRHLGHYDVKGDQIVLNQYDGVCATLLGTYQWEMDGNTLHLTPINDTCTGSSRSEELGGRSWILQP